MPDEAPPGLPDEAEPPGPSPLSGVMHICAYAVPARFGVESFTLSGVMHICAYVAGAGDAEVTAVAPCATGGHRPFMLLAPACVSRLSACWWSSCAERLRQLPRPLCDIVRPRLKLRVSSCVERAPRATNCRGDSREEVRQFFARFFSRAFSQISSFLFCV